MLSPIYSRTQLVWVYPSTKYAAFELRTEKDLVGTLQQFKPGGNRFFAKAADGAWTFTRSGLLRPRVLVTRIAEVQPLAILQTRRNGGTFRMRYGHIYTWLSQTGWFREGHWTDYQDRVLIRLYRAEGLTIAGQVIVQPAACVFPELSLLILLGWYLLVRELEDYLIIV